MIAFFVRFFFRVLLWLLRLALRGVWLGLRLLAHGLVALPLWGSQSLTARGRTRRTERAFVVVTAVVALAWAWLLVGQLAGLAGLHGPRAALIAFAIALAVVAVGGRIAWSRWLRSPAGLCWQLTRELENPRRRGYRRPRASVQEVRLP